MLCLASMANAKLQTKNFRNPVLCHKVSDFSSVLLVTFKRFICHCILVLDMYSAHDFTGKTQIPKNYARDWISNPEDSTPHETT